MVVQTGVLASLAFLLALAAGSKLFSRGPRTVVGATLSSVWAARAVAGAELLLAASVLRGPSVPAGFVLAGAFALFSLIHIRRWRDGRAEDCGCFGDAKPRSPFWRISLSAISALAAGVAAASAPPSLVQLSSTRPDTAAVVALAGAAVAWLWRYAFLAGARASLTDRLVASSASYLERRMSRRTMLVRLATAGSALTVAPLRYLLYPGTAMAVISPGSCSGGLCTDGYTAFCCEINKGRNTCPAGTFPGGWWMCTDYTGRELCHQQGVRYYVDCNQIPGNNQSGPCRCAHDSCAYRRVACNVFRYGQCNTQVSGVTAVVCRMVVCENPGQIPDLNCSSSVAVDDNVCGQDVPCLQQPARELAGSGGV